MINYQNNQISSLKVIFKYSGLQNLEEIIL